MFEYLYNIQILVMSTLIILHKKFQSIIIHTKLHFLNTLFGIQDHYTWDIFDHDEKYGH